MSERRFSLRGACREYGISRPTLRAWLIADGLFFPKLYRNQKFFIRQSDIERVIGKREPHADFARLRAIKGHRERTQVA